MHLKRKINKEICEVSQTDPAELKDVMEKYEQLQGFHKFLIKRRDGGEPMPETQDELHDIYRYERPTFLMKKEKEKEKYSKVQRKRLFWRHHT